MNKTKKNKTNLPFYLSRSTITTLIPNQHTTTSNAVTGCHLQ